MEHEASLRLAIFFGLLIGMALWEVAAPRRPATLGRKGRWPANLGIAILDSLVVRILLPGGAVAFAAAYASTGYGLLPLLGVPDWLAFVLAIAALDLAIYFQHRLFHAVPVLWRLHRMHHSDVDLDVTSGARFHPAEILLSIAIKLGAIAVLGAPAAAVRSDPQRLFDVQPRQCRDARLARAGVALRFGHARSAPHPPFARADRDRQQFRVLGAMVGPAVRHLSS
jgi:sterol desaturase/sphingolipid hydroxylase (fatty acid hydroxylase superfamily)